MTLTIMEYNSKGKLLNVEEWENVIKIKHESQEYIKNGTWLTIWFDPESEEYKQFKYGCFSYRLTKHTDYELK